MYLVVTCACYIFPEVGKLRVEGIIIYFIPFELGYETI